MFDFHSLDDLDLFLLGFEFVRRVVQIHCHSLAIIEHKRDAFEHAVLEVDFKATGARSPAEERFVDLIDLKV